MRRTHLHILLFALTGALADVFFSSGTLKHRAPCYVPSLDPSALPLQLVSHVVNFRDEHGAMHDRRSLIPLYASFFAGQVLFNALPFGGVDWSYECSVDNHFFYTPCLGDFFDALFREPPQWCTERIPFSGVLFHHNDMWVNPVKLLAFPRDKVWLAERGLPNNNPSKINLTCLSGPELAADCGWGWCDKNRDYPGQLSIQEEGLIELQALQANLTRWPPGQLCRGHADIWYIPTRFMQSFARISSVFKRTFHECAVPTAIQIALTEAGASDQFQHLSCNGSCCDRAGMALGEYNCAHRLDLLNETVRELVATTLVRLHA
jgi:hypothetical protein